MGQWRVYSGEVVEVIVCTKRVSSDGSISIFTFCFCRHIKGTFLFYIHTFKFFEYFLQCILMTFTSFTASSNHTQSGVLIL